jgi:hypothetical protein
VGWPVGECSGTPATRQAARAVTRVENFARHWFKCDRDGAKSAEEAAKKKEGQLLAEA